MDKIHFYDGLPYQILFDPVLKEVRKIIKEEIQQGSKVVDIGCGTGALVFDLADSCSKVVGVELSSKMIKHAVKRKSKKDLKNVEFVQADATNLQQFKKKQFDYATISMMLHEVPENLRDDILKEAKRIAKKVIIADYTTPLPRSLFGLGAYIVEFLAGTDHFNGFKSYQKNNGLNQLLKKSKLKKNKEVKAKRKTVRVVIAE